MHRNPARKFGRSIVVILAAFACYAALAQERNEPDPDEDSTVDSRPMTAERLGELITNVDGEAVLDANTWYFNVAGLDTVMIYDVLADRMRIMIPIGQAGELETEELLRLMQANFDSALDARYAVAQGMLWGTYIHPLSTLTDEEFLVGLGQTANVVLSFGSSYSSGMFMFNGGDSAEIEQQRLIEELKKQKT